MRLDITFGCPPLQSNSCISRQVHGRFRLQFLLELLHGRGIAERKSIQRRGVSKGMPILEQSVAQDVMTKGGSGVSRPLIRVTGRRRATGTRVVVKLDEDQNGGNIADRS